MWAFDPAHLQLEGVIDEMNNPRRHHYVPRFHQKRFADNSGRLWVWDKATDRVFPSTAGSIAVELDFYKLHQFERLGYDPFTMERQLSEMDSQMSLITENWLRYLRSIALGQQITIPPLQREIVSRFMAVQFLRTADTRDVLCAIHDADHPDKALSSAEKTGLHTELMWDLGMVERIANYIKKAIWIFARNTSSTPLVTSDNPIAFKTRDDSMWLKVGFISDGTYAVYPLAPDVIMFCHERGFWKNLEAFDNHLSPVPLNGAMAEIENSGQVFMAKRFIISPSNDFRFAREFAETIGTDTYARDEFPKFEPIGVRHSDGEKDE